MTIETIYENNRSHKQWKVKVTNPYEMQAIMLADGYMEEPINWEASVDAYNDGEWETYYRNCGILTDAIMEWLQDKYEAKMEDIIVAQENGQSYDEEFYDCTLNENEFVQNQWILDELSHIREYVSIT